MISDALLLHHSNPAAWTFFPDFLSRVDAFCRRYDSDINVPMFNEYLRMSFVSSKPSALMILGLNSEATPVAHMVAIAERWFGSPIVTIVQLESEERIPQKLWDECKASLEMFCRIHDAKLMQMAARNEAVARLYRRQGFEKTRILCRAPVEGRENQTPQV